MAQVRNNEITKQKKPESRAPFSRDNISQDSSSRDSSVNLKGAGNLEGEFSSSRLNQSKHSNQTTVHAELLRSRVPRFSQGYCRPSGHYNPATGYSFAASPHGTSALPYGYASGAEAQLPWGGNVDFHSGLSTRAVDASNQYPSNPLHELVAWRSDAASVDEDIYQKGKGPRAYRVVRVTIKKKVKKLKSMRKEVEPHGN